MRDRGPVSHVANVTRNGGSEWKLSDESTHEHGQGLEEVYPGPAKSKAILRHLTPACSLAPVGQARNEAAAGSVVVLGWSESEQATGGRSGRAQPRPRSTGPASTVPAFDEGNIFTHSESRR